MSLQDGIESFGCLPKISITESHGRSVSSLFRKLHTDFQRGCACLYSQQPWVRAACFSYALTSPERGSPSPTPSPALSKASLLPHPHQPWVRAPHFFHTLTSPEQDPLLTPSPVSVFLYFNQCKTLLPFSVPTVSCPFQNVTEVESCGVRVISFHQT